MRSVIGCPTLLVSSKNAYRSFESARFASACPVAKPRTTNITDDLPDCWSSAQPFANIPGPNRFQFLRWFGPGGRLRNESTLGIQRYLHERYGTVCRVPGFWGQSTTLYSFDPQHFELVFRTEGAAPVRHLLDTVGHYRRQNADVYPDGAGLLNEQGERWRQQRAAVSPIVMSAQLCRNKIPGCDKVSRQMVRRIEKLRSADAKGEMPANFFQEIGMWSMEGIGTIVLDREFGLLADASAEGVKKRGGGDVAALELIQAIQNFLRLAFELEMKPAMWRYFKTRNLAEQTKSLDLMTEIVSKFINEALQKKENRTDEEPVDLKTSMLQGLIEKHPQYAFLTIFDLLVAGIDTVAASMATLLYHLAINPEQQERLREEVFELLPQVDSPMNDDNFERFTYLRACLKESMRMQPQVPGIMRAAGKNIILDGYRIPKDTDIFMANQLLYHSNEHFADSERFVPERWLRNSAQAATSMRSENSFVYMPLGFGPRKCIGKRFADMEIQLLTARILREYRLEWHQPPMKFNNSIVIVPGNDLKLRFVRL